MLASVLRSEKAIKMSIAIVRAFIAFRQMAVNYRDIADKLFELRERIGEHDVQLNKIYNALENLLDEKVVQKKWEEREPIGFKR